MKNRLFYWLVFTGCLLLDLHISAQETDIFRGLGVGDRIEVILKNNRAFRGIIKAIKSDRITLDISYDEPVLKGTVSFFRDDIKDISQLRKLDEEEKKRFLAEKKRFLEIYRKEAQRVQEPIPKETSPEETPLPPLPPEKTEEEKERERLLALLVEFPPPEWSQARYDEIQQKILNFRTNEEQRFLEVYNDWLKAVELHTRLERRKLLEKFPPDKGWGEEKYQRLRKKFIVTGVALRPEEKEFVSKFKDWQKALEEKKEDEAREKERAGEESQQ